MPVPTTPEEVKTYTDPPTEQELKEIIKNKDKIDDEKTAIKKKEIQDVIKKAVQTDEEAEIKQQINEEVMKQAEENAPSTDTTKPVDKVAVPPLKTADGNIEEGSSF